MRQMVELKKITDDNMDECIGLKVTKEQDDFVVSNLYSLADAYVIISGGGHVRTYAIYADDVMVGFIQYGCIDDVMFGMNYYHVWRLMIDKDHQGKGYGKQSLAQVINEIKMMPYGKGDYICALIDRENTVSRNLFTSFGFEEVEKRFGHDDDEVFLRLNLHKQ